MRRFLVDCTTAYGQKRVVKVAQRFAFQQRQNRRHLADHYGSRRAGKYAARNSPLSSPSATSSSPSSSMLTTSATAIPTSSENRSPISFVPVASPLAYHHRLTHGHYEHVMELVKTPYAPHPLLVLRDVLQGGQASQGKVNALQISCLFDDCARQAMDAVHESEIVGDATSEESLHHVMAVVGEFQAFVESNIKTCIEEALPSPGTVAVLLRQHMKLCSTMGIVESSVFCLNALIDVAVSSKCKNASSNETDGVVESDLLDLDDVATAELNALEHPTTASITAEDHITAMQSCIKQKRFNIALALYRQFVTEAHRLSGISEEHLSAAVIALAKSVESTSDFTTLRDMIKQDDLSCIAVSEPLYTSLIGAASHALQCEDRAQFAVALYRRLRDGHILPTADTYSALIAVCASTQEPTHAFAFYQEALTVCGGSETFPPALYANLILSYARAGFRDDCRTMLEVLMEARAPLTRSSFHAALSCAGSSRDAGEIVELMTSSPYNITPTPSTYGFLLAVEAEHLRGIESLLHAYDVHAQCSRFVSRLLSKSSGSLPDVMEYLVNHEPKYCTALEDLCMRLNVDPGLDSRVGKYLRPLAAVAQRHATKYLNNTPPQRPTILPVGSYAVILAADILANLEEYFLPSAHYFSAIIVPYTSVAVLRRSTAKSQERHGGKLSRDTDEFDSMAAARQLSLNKFLKRFAAVVHVMSLEEEMQAGRDIVRYGVGMQQLSARPAIVAMNLARRIALTDVYAQHQCQLVLATTQFHKCGRYLVDNQKRMAEDDPAVAVRLWNPRYQPEWSPQGEVSSTHIARMQMQCDLDAAGGANLPLSSVEMAKRDVADPMTSDVDEGQLMDLMMNDR